MKKGGGNMKSLLSKATAVWAATLITAFLSAWESPVHAEDKYPARAIHLIVPFNAGGASDIVARVIGNSISEKLGQPVIVENRPGATGMIGSLAVARAAPEGYTILMAVISSHAVAPAMKKEPP